MSSMDISQSNFVPPPADPFRVATVRQWTVEHVIGRRGDVRFDYLEEQRARRGWRGRSVLGYRLPDFQRGYAWTRDQQVAFIESVLEGYDIGRYVVNIDETSDGFGSGPLDHLLVDGQQRLGAIEAYVADAFPVHGDVFSRVPLLQKRRLFLHRVFPCVEARIDDPAEIERVYRRLAYGGTPHQAERTVPALKAARAALAGRAATVVADIDAALAEWGEAA